MKEYILGLDQIKLFSVLLDIPEDDIRDSINYKLRLNSPFHVDKDPSLLFKFYGSRLICTDFGYNVRGDIFDITGYIMNLNSRDTDFRDICKYIIDNLDKDSSTCFIRKIEDDTPDQITITAIDVIHGAFDEYDYRFFYNYFIPRNIVDAAYIPVKRYYINDRLSNYKSCRSDPCYAYLNNPNSIKLYFPLRTKASKLTRFISNNRIPIELIHTIVPKDFTILIKGYKDKLLMDYVCNYLNITNIQFIPIASETAVLDNTIVNFINSKTLVKTFTMFDIDTTGLSSSKFYEDSYDFKPLIISTIAKDPTDVITKVKFEQFVKLFIQLNKQIQKWIK